MEKVANNEISRLKTNMNIMGYNIDFNFENTISSNLKKDIRISIDMLFNLGIVKSNKLNSLINDTGVFYKLMKGKSYKYNKRLNVGNGVSIYLFEKNDKIIFFNPLYYNDPKLNSKLFWILSYLEGDFLDNFKNKLINKCEEELSRLKNKIKNEGKKIKYILGITSRKAPDSLNLLKTHFYL